MVVHGTVAAAVLLLFLLQYTQGKKNVLILIADDMRANINAYEPDFPTPTHPKMHTPNLDALAARSLLLKKAYVQQAECVPSRSSITTGRRPDTTHVYTNIENFRKVGGNYVTIPQYFKQHGYTTLGMGKTFPDLKSSWTEPYYNPPNVDYWKTHNISWLAVDEQTRRKMPLPDEQTSDHAIQVIRELAQTPDKPFFLAVGFHKPHLPFVFPEEFFAYYPQEDVHLPDNKYAPVNMPDVAWHVCDSLVKYKDIELLNSSFKINTTIPPKIVLELRRAYYSALSFTDFLMGEVVRALEDHGLASNTIISVWGDHGFQLGENGAWCKKTNFELAVNAPMMLHVPGLTDHGIVSEELTEFVDLFPTLADAAGLPPLPLCPQDSTKVALCREGNSLMPLVTGDTAPAWKKRVFSQYPRPGSHMGYTMRTPDFRYTEWVKFKGAPHYVPVWDENVGTELYDHGMDPEENYNHAGEAAYRAVQKKLSKQLRAGWRDALPNDDSAVPRDGPE